MVVFAALFWLQSMNTRPARSAFAIWLTTRSGWSASIARASSRATPETCSLDQAPSRCA